MSSPCCKPTKGCPDPEQPKYDYFYGRDGYEQPSQDSCCAVEQPRGQCCGGFNGAPLSSSVVGRPLCNACPGDVETSESISNRNSNDAVSYRQEEVAMMDNNHAEQQQSPLQGEYAQAGIEDDYDGENVQMSSHMSQMYRQCGSCGGGNDNNNSSVFLPSASSAGEYNQNDLVGDQGNATGSPNVNVASSELAQQPQYDNNNRGGSMNRQSSISGMGQGLMNRMQHPWIWAIFLILVLGGLAYGFYYWYKHGGKKMLGF